MHFFPTKEDLDIDLFGQASLGDPDSRSLAHPSAQRKLDEPWLGYATLELPKIQSVETAYQPDGIYVH